MTPDEIAAKTNEAKVRLAAAWASVVVAMRNRYTQEELGALIAAGRFEEAADAVVTAASKFAASWNNEFVKAGQATATEIEQALRSAARGEVVVDFNMVHTDAVRAMQENQLRLVREISDQQRRALRESMASGVQRGLNPIDQAREFRQAIGLTQRQVRAVNNYRRLLETNDPEALSRALRDKRFDRAVRRAVKDGQPLTKQQVDNMVNRYRERSLKNRKETIARTEALRSVHQGTHNMFRQAVTDGTLTNDELVREWNTAKDERVRTFSSTSGKTSHASMHGQQVRGLDVPFISGAGNALLYPGDPIAPGYDTIQCRCAVGTRMDLKAGEGVLSVEVIEA